ncbi:hypothetical protein FHS00_001313 [Limimaricola variabilis]|uniref:Uncharacterized protein n=1 Tax=Limimaricola variabilis TaxID=1492771 RepID=A0ABR6HMF6_9RHOB|nr:hypothetical protein [Limimaricola variabilis]MBB3711742.1 hypothetical protein [Limimaricola variabilis]
MSIKIDPAEVRLIGEPCEKTGIVRVRYRGYEFEAKVLELFRVRKFKRGAATEIVAFKPERPPQSIAAETLSSLFAAMSNHERLEFISTTQGATND